MLPDSEKRDERSQEHQLPRLIGKKSLQASKIRRRHPRAAMGIAGVLQILNPFSDDCSEVRVLDSSEQGLKLYVPFSVMPGSLVKVRMNDNLAFGDARYCIPEGEGFFVGIQLHDYFPRATTRLGCH
jgi:hypothetical protein